MMPLPGQTNATPIVPIPPATALSYDQSSQLMTDLTFRGRVKVACLSYASYISNESPETVGHNSRMKWAAQCFQSPDQWAQTVANPVVMDPNVQSQGSAIDDNTLQSAVGGVVDKMM